MSYHHLSTFERGRIEELLTLGYTNRAIATRLGRHHSCIDRELERNEAETGYTGVSSSRHIEFDDAILSPRKNNPVTVLATVTGLFRFSIHVIVII